MRQPRGGVPDPEWEPSYFMLVVVPIYDQRDVARTCSKTFRGGIIESGMEANTFVSAMFFVSNEMPDNTYDVVMIVVTHVDDLPCVTPLIASAASRTTRVRRLSSGRIISVERISSFVGA